MMQHSSSRSRRTRNAALSAALAVGLIAPAFAQTQVTGSTTTTTDSQGTPQQNVTLNATVHHKKKHHEKVSKADRVQQTKDTKREVKKEARDKTIVAQDQQLPDKQLYDKAIAQEKSGHFDVARLDLETLLDTYPDSQYLMQAKLAIADCWYKEGGTAAMAQAEDEYKDFITFFPNSPEAAEAQMRVGDIYFKQMDVPDRDYTNAEHAETEYRTLLKQYPDAPPAVLAEARQKLRDVQEVLATREANIGQFYAQRGNYAAAIARYQTVADTYPQYSHMDDVLIGIGDAYAAQSKTVRNTQTCAKGVVGPCLTEGMKARLEQYFDSKAATDYRDVVLYHAAAPHAEFAKERLAAMNLPIPQPTPQELAASEALEGSRAQYTLQKRLELLFLHSPDMVDAARIGNPPLDDPPAVVAPTVVKQLEAEYAYAVNPAAHPNPELEAAHAAPAAAPSTDNGTTTEFQPAPENGSAAPTLSDVPVASGAPDTSGSVSEVSPVTTEPSGATTSTGVGSEIISTGAPATVTTPSEAARDLPAATGKPDPNYGFTAVAPKNSAPLPAVEKPAEAPDQVNEVAGKQQPAIPQSANGKKVKSPFDKQDESSSKHKPKKGLKKLNPF